MTSKVIFKDRFFLYSTIMLKEYSIYNDQEKLKGKTKFEICGRSSYSTIHKTESFDNGFEKKKLLGVRAE